MNPVIIPPMNLIRGVVFCGLIGLLVLGLWLPVNAASDKQEGTATPTTAAVPLNEYQIPTPGENGRILYMVQPGDTCTRIALLNKITVDQLKQLNQNKLDEDCDPVIAGDTLLIGIAEANSGTPTGPTPTAGPPTPTSTPFTGTTEICVLLFDDQNGDGFRQETEPAIEGGAISVTENNGEYSAAQDTVINPDPEAYPGILLVINQLKPVLVLLFVGANLYRFFTIPINKSGYKYKKAIVEEIKVNAESYGYPCVAVSYITDPGLNMGYRYFFWRKGLHVNRPDSGSPVYTIVYPLKDIFPVDKTFGALGLIYPEYTIYDPDSVKNSCSGEDSNLTDPLFGYTE